MKLYFPNLKLINMNFKLYYEKIKIKIVYILIIYAFKIHFLKSFYNFIILTYKSSEC